MKSLESVTSPIACEYPFQVLETLKLESQSALSKVPEKFQSVLANTLY